jgi:hypothetical protein
MARRDVPPAVPGSPPARLKVGPDVRTTRRADSLQETVMMNRLIPVVLVAVLSATPLWAHPGHDHRFMGTVTAVAGVRMTMETPDGQTLTFTVNRETKFVRGREDGRVSEITVGMRVIVNLGDGIEPLVAKEVRYQAVQPE